MKQLLLFCSLLFCLPAFTAHLHTSDVAKISNPGVDAYSPFISKMGDSPFALRLRGGGDALSQRLQRGPTVHSHFSQLEDVSSMQCEEFDAATLRPAKLPALKPPSPKSFAAQYGLACNGIAELSPASNRARHGAYDDDDDSLMEDERCEEPGTSVSGNHGGSPGQVADERVGKNKRQQLKVGDSMNNRLTVTTVLGAGAFGTVYMAKDQRTGENVAVKVQRAGKRHWQVAQDEIRLLKAVAAGKKRFWNLQSQSDERGSGEVVRLLASFAIPSPEGPQVCLAQELLGPSLLDLVIDYGYAGIPLRKVRSIMRDVLQGLDYLHTQCRIIHTDVKPENVLLKLPPGSANSWWLDAREPGEDGKLRKGWSMKKEWEASGMGAKLVDLGNACFAGRPFTDDIQTIEYRCPEVVLGAGYDSSADLWSAACMAFELITGEYLFDPQEGVGADGKVLYGKDEDLLALHQELLGPMPRHLALNGRLSPLLVDEHGRLLHISNLKFWGLQDVLVEKYGMEEAEAAGIASFLLPMLKLDPKERPTAAQMLQHPWLRK